MTSTCPHCGSALRSAYQRIAAKPAEYIVFCSRLSACPGWASQTEGRGETEQKAIEDYKQKTNATLRR